MSPSEDQLPQGWSDGATGYEENFGGLHRALRRHGARPAGGRRRDRALDVAAGTGATSMPAVARGATVLATDFAPWMVRVAEQRLRDRGFAGSSARQMDGQALDLADDSYDAGVSMFGLMFFPDPGAGVAELARLVRPGGRIGIATWDLEAYAMHRLIGALLEVAVPGFGDHERPSPTWAPLGTVDGLATLLGAAAVTQVDVRSVVQRWHFEDPARFFRRDALVVVPGPPPLPRCCRPTVSMPRPPRSPRSSRPTTGCRAAPAWR